MASEPDQLPAKQDRGADESAIQQLLSTDQGELLDIIDKLREYGISGDLELPLPQIIVCGDQSSGKSSVLEAISGRTFPKGENVCTTFATQLALRRRAIPSVTVSIIPSSTRTEDEAARLNGFQPKSSNIENFEDIVQEAKSFLHSQIKANKDSYFRDVLHVSVSQPSLPPLTLVDLPGIIHSASSKQTDRDIEEVHKLVMDYMKDTNSIILAVVSAENDLEVQIILNMIKKVDPKGKRTLGIITKPDTLIPGQKRETMFLTCARNDEHKLELGWHVVKNLGPTQEGKPKEDRDAAEREFFSTGVWKNSLRKSQLGIAELRHRLSELLEQRTRPALSKIIRIIKTSLNECREELNRLGQPRSTAPKQRSYLLALSQHFQKITEQSVEGTYKDEAFFGRASSMVDPKRLRAAVNNLNDIFAKTMRQRGHRREFINSNSERHQKYEEMARRGPSMSMSPKTHVDYPLILMRSDYLKEIEEIDRQNRGNGLPGLPNHNIIPRLFQEQSEPWVKIATQHIENTRNVIQANLELIANFVAIDETSLRLRRYLISPELDLRQEKAMEKLNELMKPYRRGSIITLDESFLGEVQRLLTPSTIEGDSNYEDEGDEEGISSRIQNVHSSSNGWPKGHPPNSADPRIDPQASATFMLQYMLAYYKVRD
jgi:GTPase SAR1 family protein